VIKYNFVFVIFYLLPTRFAVATANTKFESQQILISSKNVCKNVRLCPCLLIIEIGSEARGNFVHCQSRSKYGRDLQPKVQPLLLPLDHLGFS